MAFLDIASGVALILFGIRFLRKGLERLFGYKFYAWVERRATRPWVAALTGVGFGTVAPSSTGQTLVALQLMRAGKLSTESVLGFLLGANLGITITVQLIALRIFEQYSVFLVVGMICFLGSAREAIRGAGQSALGLGFVFLAMEITTNAAVALTSNRDFTTIFEVISSYPLLVVICSAVLTLALQSSTATIGLAFAIAMTEATNHALILPVVLGTNVGMGLTSLVAGLPTWEGRRLAAANLLLKGGTVALALGFLSTIESWLSTSPGTLVQQGANFHTAFNLLVTVLGVALARPLGKLMEKTVKPGVTVATSPTTHLDPAALSTPMFALANATRETLRLADGVKSMLEGAWRAFSTQDAELAAQVQRQDDRIDELNAAIKLYLSHIPGDALPPADQKLHFGLLNFSSQLESIADVIDKSLCGTVIEHKRDGLALESEDRVALEELHRKVMRRFDAAITLLATRDRALARDFLQESEKLKEWSIVAQKQHYDRLQSATPQAMIASTRFLDAFNVLRRVSGQLNTIGHTFILS